MSSKKYREFTQPIERVHSARNTNTWFYWRSYYHDWTPFCVQKIYSETLDGKEIGFRMFLN